MASDVPKERRPISKGEAIWLRQPVRDCEPKFDFLRFPETRGVRMGEKNTEIDYNTGSRRTIPCFGTMIAKRSVSKQPQ